MAEIEEEIESWNNDAFWDDGPVNEATSFKGNPNLKKVGHQHQFTAQQIQEVEKCISDPIYFIENYCHITSLDKGLVKFKLYDCQKRKVRTILDNRKVIVMEPRQNGKTVTAAACILWYILFQDRKTVAILANKGDSAREVMDRLQLMYEMLPIWLQQGVITWNKGDIKLENGSKVFTAATTSSGIRGKSVNWLYVDEAAIIPNNVAESFFASVIPTISSGTTTKMLITSTPLGYNTFWKFWNESNEDQSLSKNGFVRLQIHYWEVPGRDEKWAAEQLKSLGEVKYNQEVMCHFLGSSYTLISGRALGLMTSSEPILDNEEGLCIYEQPMLDRIYVIVVDTSRGVGGDFSALTIIDVTEVPYKLVARYKSNTISPLLFPNVVWRLARDYHDAWVLVESNDIGAQTANILYTDLEYENVFSTGTENKKTFISGGFAKATDLGVRTTKTVKRQGCFAIKTLVEEFKIQIPDAATIMEFSTFVEKNGSYQADEGYHDDLVMTLVLFGWLTTNQFFKELTDVDMRERVFKQQMQQIEDEITPFGVIDRGEPETQFVEDGDVWNIVAEDSFW
jgi:hypothetical protein